MLTRCHVRVTRTPEVAWPQRAVSDLRFVNLGFQGLDSPAAWAAQTRGLRLLDEGDVTKEAVFRSADAICELLRVGHGNSTLCSEVQQRGLTKRNTGFLPLLSPEGVVKTLSCLHSVGQYCKINNTWYYSGNRPGVLDLAGHEAKVGLSTLAKQLVSQANDYSKAFMRTLQACLFKIMCELSLGGWA